MFERFLGILLMLVGVVLFIVTPVGSWIGGGIAGAVFMTGLCLLSGIDW